MSGCDRLSDRMPTVALGRGGWSQQEAEHLQGCQSCREEWDLVQVAGRLHRAADLELDAATITRAVLERLAQTDQGRRGRAWAFAGLAAAAAIAVVVLTGPGPTSGERQPEVAARLEFPLPELENLEPAELNSVWENLDEPADGSSVEAPDTGEAEFDDVDFVLDSWEG